ncbi:hypothetical protein A3F66_00805 [candidate division TM6 bacterium RIFCSPHIGHO2_12_FULL_32_22]|nr:MAG: hypothetical protein A3F66_00805 [candidate division TM6 bacterium RIFCSPHIGHO2_12_FULL_32_22]
MKKQLFWLFPWIFAASCTKKSVVKVDLSEKKSLYRALAAPKVTVWVHGTKLFTSKIFPTFFYSKPGLLHVSDYACENHLRKLGDWLYDFSPEEFPLGHFYQFGWSGDLSVKARENAARELSDALAVLMYNYKEKYDLEPNLTLITHSHGGNVALNLAKFHESVSELTSHPSTSSGRAAAHGEPVEPYERFCKKSSENYKIDRLILLACPVQKETKSLVSSDLFKKVYSLYSSLDSIQVLDPQGLQYKTKNEKDSMAPLFSQREFESAPNLKQGKVKLHGRGIAHVEFLLKPFLKNLSRLIFELENSKDQNVILSVWDNKNCMK